MDNTTVILKQELKRLKKEHKACSDYLINHQEYKGFTLRRSRKGADSSHYYVLAKKSGENNYKYLGRGDSDLVKGIGFYKQCERTAANLARKIDALEKCLSIAPQCDLGSIRSSLYPVYRSGDPQELLNELFPLSTNGAAWYKEKEPGYLLQEEYKPEGLRHVCSDGTRVRSKSELIIVETMIRKKIPFFYELEHDINGTIMHPDFTAYSEKFDCEIIIEHLGMMNELNYIVNTYDKLYKYLMAGWNFGRDLLVTYDDSDGNIDVRMINALLDSFFVK
jgi:hypothetical protein